MNLIDRLGKLKIKLHISVPRLFVHSKKIIFRHGFEYGADWIETYLRTCSCQADMRLVGPSRCKQTSCKIQHTQRQKKKREKRKKL